LLAQQSVGSHDAVSSRTTFSRNWAPPLCAGFNAGGIMVPTALRNDELSQHNQEKTQEGND